MKLFNSSGTKQTPPIFDLAAQVDDKKNQDSSQEQLTQKRLPKILPKLRRQASLQHQIDQKHPGQAGQQKLKLILISGITGAGLALGGLWGYNAFTNHSTPLRRVDLNNNPIGPIPPAQPLPPPPLTPPPAQPLPSPPLTPPYPDNARFHGKVQIYLLNPEGLVNGLMLDNNRQVNFPPHLANSIVATVKPGDEVTIVGDPGIASSIGQEIRGFSITNTRTQRTVTAQPPSYPPSPPSTNYSNLSVSGIVRHWLVGHRGEIRGMILSSGVQIRFPPHVGEQLFAIAQDRANVQAQGFGTITPWGEVLEVTSLTVNGQPVSLYPEIRGQGDKETRRQGEKRIKAISN